MIASARIVELITGLDGIKFFWNDVNVRRDDVDRNFIVHVWRAENAIKIVLIHSISKKICFYVLPSNSHSKLV